MIETVAMKQETKEMRAKTLRTVVKYKEGMKSGRWTSIGQRCSVTGGFFPRFTDGMSDFTQ